jgi:hypothetical protein
VAAGASASHVVETQATLRGLVSQSAVAQATASAIFNFLESATAGAVAGAETTSTCVMQAEVEASAIAEAILTVTGPIYAAIEAGAVAGADVSSLMTMVNECIASVQAHVLLFRTLEAVARVSWEVRAPKNWTEVRQSTHRMNQLFTKLHKELDEARSRLKALE